LFDIDAPIKKIVPSLVFGNRWNSSDSVRLVHLLEHTSGFDESHFHLVARANSSTPLSEVMRLSRSSLNTRWPPGKYYEYNTLGYVAAAHVIEEKVGVPLHEFVRDNLLLPLEMHRATYFPTTASTSDFSKGYEGENFVEVPFPDLPVWPAGTLTASVEDMANFVSMLLNEGWFNNEQVLTPAAINRMETPESSIRAQSGIRHGYGKGLQGTFEKGYLVYGHGGQAGGFVSAFGYSRELDIGYVILLNNRDGNRAIKAIKKELFGALGLQEKTATPSSSRTDIDEIEMIVGGYQRMTGMGQLGKLSHFAVRLMDLQFIVEENGRLYQKSVVGGKQALIHVEGLLFRRGEESIATSVFKEAQDGNWLWLDEAAYRQIPTWWGYFQFYIAVADLSRMSFRAVQDLTKSIKGRLSDDVSDERAE
jgi:CubicO group peptidase (beta-lactamase class C family)